MQQFSPADVRTYGVGLMPNHGPPSPLGRLVQRRRLELGIATQVELSDITAAQGLRVPANTISRLESGATRGMRNHAYLDALAKALKLDSDLDFILGAYAPGLKGEHREPWRTGDAVMPSGSEGAILALVRDQPEERKRRALEVLKLIFAESG